MMKLLLFVLVLASGLGVSAQTTDATSQETEKATTLDGQTTPKATAATAETVAMTIVATGRMTEATEITVMSTNMKTENSTENTTSESRTTGVTTLPLSTLAPVGRYAVNGTNGTCILMQFYLEISITYNNTEGKTDEKSLVFPDNSVPMGNCTDNARYFTVTYPEFNDWYLRLDFDVEDQMYEMTSVTFQWKFEEPFFLDADKMGQIDEVQLQDPEILNVRADTGKTFKCNKRQIEIDSVGITIKEIMYQPYADQSAEKGGFGDVEVCIEDQPTVKPPGTTQAQVDNTGMIVGICIGCVAGVILVIGGLYYFIRHRQKRESYKSLD
ncbi:lysosome-associated membrane glycoprotein 1-like [Acanthaster planci]|uniref:Lysosome-associated membrane glycoprotein 5 n=1 Tax=Acanthaster planci TaxID=133434 RepID=A0A8B7ZF99_ACAPL|nr:lysosome-associated membrane glycoprotein 1-like [Acanthaster planci]